MEIQEELEDRFSDIPPSVQNLIDIAYIKSAANKVGIEEIKEKGNEVIIKFESKKWMTDSLVKGIMKKYNRKIIFKLGDEPVLGYGLKDVKKEELIYILRELVEYIQSVVETK
jgi:transcription-repair coupling factor (superfamily II helicase)